MKNAFSPDGADGGLVSERVPLDDGDDGDDCGCGEETPHAEPGFLRVWAALLRQMLTALAALVFTTAAFVLYPVWQLVPAVVVRARGDGTLLCTRSPPRAPG
jgi:hypothetical protein